MLGESGDITQLHLHVIRKHSSLNTHHLLLLKTGYKPNKRGNVILRHIHENSVVMKSIKCYTLMNVCV
jgi:hypothetical protein